MATGLNFLGTFCGNWIYIRYRGKNGLRDWILENAPNFHNSLMEFKEFVAFSPFPIMLVAAFILFYYRDAIQFRRDLVLFVGRLIMVSWFCRRFSTC